MKGITTADSASKPSFLHQTPGPHTGQTDSPSFFWGDHLHLLYSFGPTGINDCVRDHPYMRQRQLGVEKRCPSDAATLDHVLRVDFPSHPDGTRAYFPLMNAHQTRYCCFGLGGAGSRASQCSSKKKVRLVLSVNPASLSRKSKLVRCGYEAN